MQALGAGQDVIAAAMGNMKTAEDFELFEDNVQSARVFDAMTTQWRRGGMDGIPTGLDYAPLPVVMRLCGVKPSERRAVFEDVRTMELETLNVMSERAAK